MNWLALALPLVLAGPAAHAAGLERATTYVETWRSDATEHAPYFFGTPGQIRTDPSGAILVLDTQTQTLHRFDRDGRYRGMWIRSGPGPGELERCSTFEIWGETKLAFPRARGSISQFDIEGNYIDSLVLEGSRSAAYAYVSRAVQVGEGIAVLGQRPGPAPGVEERVLALHSETGALRRELYVKSERPRDYSKPALTIREIDTFFAGSRFTWDDRGHLYVAPERDSFEIVKFDESGREVQRIELDWPLRTRTPEEIEAKKLEYVVTGSPGMKLPELTYEIEASAPPIARLLWAEEELWVELEGRPEDPECIGRFAILDESGRIREIREIRAPGVTEEDRTQVLRDGRVAVVKHFRSATRSRFAHSNIRIGGEEPKGPDASEMAEFPYIIVFEPGR